MPCLVLHADVLVKKKKQSQVFVIPKSHVCFVHFTPSTENLTLGLKQNTKLSINNGENPSDSESLHWVFPKLSWSVLERETLTKCNIKVKKLVT